MENVNNFDFTRRRLWKSQQRTFVKSKLIFPYKPPIRQKGINGSLISPLTCGFRVLKNFFFDWKPWIWPFVDEIHHSTEFSKPHFISSYRLIYFDIFKQWCFYLYSFNKIYFHAFHCFPLFLNKKWKTVKPQFNLDFYSKWIQKDKKGSNKSAGEYSSQFKNRYNGCLKVSNSPWIY